MMANKFSHCNLSQRISGSAPGNRAFSAHKMGFPAFPGDTELLKTCRTIAYRPRLVGGLRHRRLRGLAPASAVRVRCDSDTANVDPLLPRRPDPVYVKLGHRHISVAKSSCASLHVAYTLISRSTA